MNEYEANIEYRKKYNTAMTRDENQSLLSELQRKS